MGYTISQNIVSNGATFWAAVPSVSGGAYVEYGPIVDITHARTGAEVDTSGVSDDYDVLESGSIANRVEVTYVGPTNVFNVGTKCTNLRINYPVGDPVVLGKYVVVSAPVTITRNGRLETKLTFARTR
jgi:hypothetical protein